MKPDLLGAIILAVIGGVSLGLGIGMKVGRELCQERAIKAGVAEYTVDKTTGATAFKFITTAEKK